jgi:hypothetical protein
MDIVCYFMDILLVESFLKVISEGREVTIMMIYEQTIYLMGPDPD